jgi:hypothetical protein
MLGTGDLNINQLDPKYFSLGAAALSASVANPYFVAGGPGIVGSAKVSQAQLLRPFPAFGDIKLRFSDQNKAQYDSLVLKAQKRLSQGLTFLAAYTYSKNFDRDGAGGIQTATSTAARRFLKTFTTWPPSGRRHFSTPRTVSVSQVLMSCRSAVTKSSWATQIAPQTWRSVVG